ncbi:hypothetical protein T02_5285 [Trichinella nativa]|uniref:Uncharacterized protein n=1 Tax=Trichinella nativa TaxID=6335 RepID=A0A0V1KGL4_9BILA|nr:hypothetical protein T02_5285 [Trichinella nativa]
MKLQDVLNASHCNILYCLNILGIVKITFLILIVFLMWD